MTPLEVAKLLENQSKAHSRGRERTEGPSFASVTIDLPLPPSWNASRHPRALPPKGGKGKWRATLYISDEAKKYVKAVALVCAATGLKPFPRDQMLALSGEIRMARAGCDIDDRLKIFCDSLNGIVYEDDEQIARHDNLVRIVDSKNPGITATFTPIDVDRYGKPKESGPWTT